MERLNDKGKCIFTEQILNLEEYYSIEDYGYLLMAQVCLQTNKRFGFIPFNSIKNKGLGDTPIRVTFQVDGKPKEALLEKIMVKKIYANCKISSEDNKFINILVNRAEKYDTNEILKKINDLIMFKGALKIYLNIDEFPIKSYYLEEKEFQNNDIEREFILKK